MAGQDARKGPEMPTSGRELSANQEKALAALLVLPTIAAAARRCSLNERTIRRYLKDPAFAARYAQERDTLVDEAIAAVQKLGLAAAKAINDALGDEDVTTRLRGSRQAMDLITREREFKARVTGQIDEGTHINITNSPQWIELRAVIWEALAPYPEARMSVLRAVSGADGGNG